MFVDVRAPERKRRTPERRAELEALSLAEPDAALAKYLAPTGAWIDLDAFGRDRALSPASLDEIVTGLGLVALPLGKSRAGVSSATWTTLTATIGQTLDAFHAERPDQPGIGMEQLRRSFKPLLPSPLFLAALRKLVEAGEVALDRTWVRRPQHQARLSNEEERLLGSFLARIAAEPYRPPRVRDIAKAMGIDEGFVRRLLRLAARRGDVEEIAQDHFFTRAIVEKMAAIAIELAAAVPSGKFTAADFRDRLDNGRKVAIQILEFFDKHGFTIRRQDLRRINPARIEFFAPQAAQSNSGGVPFPVERPDFKSGWGRQTVSGGFDSHPPPPPSTRREASR